MRKYILAVFVVLTPILLSAFGPAESEVLPPPIPAKDEQTASTNVVIRVHMVEAGEDLYTIAMMYGISVARLKEVNELTGKELVAGQQIKIPLEDAPVGTSSNLNDDPLCGDVRCNRFGCSRW